mgnify:CR=1 FL=1
MEDFYLGKATERIFLPILQMMLPEISDMNFPAEGIFNNFCIVSIKKQYPGHAQKVMSAIWGLGQAMFTKVVVVVAEDVNIHDDAEVAWKVLNHIDPQRDLQFMMGPIETLDHASRAACYGSKVGVDATRKWPDEGFEREWPDEQVLPAEVKAMVERRWKEYGL